MNTQDKINLIERRLKAFVPVIDIANELNVSRIRVYQLIEEALLSLPHNKGKTDVEKIVSRMLRKSKKEATRLGVEHNIVSKDVLIPTHCPYLGTELSYTGKELPILSRIDPNMGFITGNIVVCSRRAHDIKGDATPEELHKICKALDKLNKNDV